MDALSSSSGGGLGDAAQIGVSLMSHIKVLEEEIKYNRSQINLMQDKIAALEQPRRTFSAIDPTARTEVTDDSEMYQDYMFLSAKKTIPKVRLCTFSKFKNRFHPRGLDGRYAVDVLVSGHLLHQEIQEEHKLRDKLLEQHPQMQSTRIVKDKALANAVKMANTTTGLISQVQSEEKWPRRLRIQSPALLRILGKINRERWSDRPRTYYRPFNSLIFQHEEIRDKLKELEERWGADLPVDRHPICDSESDTDCDDIAEMDTAEIEDDDDAIVDSPQALACLRAYVKYIDENIMPDYERFEKQDVFSNAKVRFSDLWYLFRTGELVYRQVAGELPDQRDFRTGKRIWKTYYVDPVPERLMPTAADDTEIQDAALVNDDPFFSLGCYYVDHTGDEYCVVREKFTIEQFSGEMPVSALPIYPMRFCQEWKARLEHAIHTGDAFIEFMKARHCSYSGWTLTRSPNSDLNADADRASLQPQQQPQYQQQQQQLQQQPEHINSEVMIDFAEAFQQFPGWRPRRAGMRQKVVEGLTVPEPSRIRWWSGPERAVLLGETTELIPVKSGVTRKQRNNYISSDPFLVAVRDNAKRLELTTERDLTRESKALLTGRVFAYIFQERKFAQLAVAKLRPSPKTGLALNLLRIPDAIKHAIQGSVQGHFLQKNAERKLEKHWVSLDLIRGKGTGLFILLHGVPGVGKTATAEAIAQANGKPLFKITVGDLGMTPEKLEVSLREIFRLASLWDCILLLDEVDTFFSQRSRADTATNKNALVSVFLRVLDYYNGILFLTTNRAGVLDEAFKSRIHYKIYYPDLTVEQTLDIWKLNIDRLRTVEEQLAKVEKRGPLQIHDRELLEFARKIFDDSGQKRGIGRWNGRQIRNAFQVARSLAYYEHGMREGQTFESPLGADSSGDPRSPGAGSAPPGPLMLDVRHFEMMHAITAQFEHYRATVHGGATDHELAFDLEYRNDRYRDKLLELLEADYRDRYIKSISPTPVPGTMRDILIPGAMSNSGAAIGSSFSTPKFIQRQQQYRYSAGEDDGYGGEPSNAHMHRNSINSRNGSSFNLPGVTAASPPTLDPTLPQINTQHTRLRSSSMRHNSGPDIGSAGMGIDNSANYIPAGSPRPGAYPTTAGSARHSSTSLSPGMADGLAYRLAPQGPQGMDPVSMLSGSLRGPSPSFGETGGIPIAGATPRDYIPQEYYGTNGNQSFSPTSREMPGTFGMSGGLGQGLWSAASRGDPGPGNANTQYAGHGRDSFSRPGRDTETDLCLDDPTC